MSQKAIVQKEIGKPLVLGTRAIPEPPEGHVLVKVISAGLNPHDQKSRDMGLFSQNHLPAVLANDVVGEIVKLGPSGTKNYRVEDRIFAQSKVFSGADHGGLQEYALLDAQFSSRIPSQLTEDEANTLPTNLLASYVALFTRAGLGFPIPGTPAADAFDFKSQTLLIVGAGSNCGKFGLQLARWAGLGTIIAVASATNEAQLKQLGATHVIDRHSSTALSDVKKLVGDDLIYSYDAFNMGVNQTLAVAALSDVKKGKAAVLLPPARDDLKDTGVKEAGYDLEHILGGSWLHPLEGDIFWNRLIAEWFEGGLLAPLDYQIVEGLDVDKVNAVYDNYAAGKPQSKVHIHP